MKAIVAFFSGIVASANNAFNQLLKIFFLTLLSMLGLTFVMWGINIFGFKELNYVFFFLGGLMVFFIGLNPAALIASVLVGAVDGGVEKTGIVKGAFNGPARLMRLIIGLLYTFFAISGILATTSFGESPSSFFAILSMVLFLAVATSFYGHKLGKLPLIIVFIYVTYVLIRALWAIVPVATKYDMGMSISSIGRIDVVIGTGSPRVRKEINHLQDIEDHVKAELKAREQKAADERAEREHEQQEEWRLENERAQELQREKQEKADALKKQEDARRDLEKKIDHALSETEK